MDKQRLRKILDNNMWESDRVMGDYYVEIIELTNAILSLIETEYVPKSKYNKLVDAIKAVKVPEKQVESYESSHCASVTTPDYQAMAYNRGLNSITPTIMELKALAEGKE